MVRFRALEATSVKTTLPPPRPEGTAEKLGEKIDDAARKAEDKLRDAADKIRDKVR